MSFRYPGAADDALRVRALEVSEGEIVLLAGPTGSGKSTLLRLLMGIVPQFSGGELCGEVEVGGTATRGVAARELAARGVAYVAQDPAEAFVSDRVATEVAFGPESLGLPADEVDVRVEEALRAVGLGGAERRRVRELSGGEQQRVALAAAVALRPRILLLDEPTAHLDEPTAREILELVASLAVERAMTMVVAEHRLGIAARLASRAVVLARGEVVRDGDPRAVLADPLVGELGVPVPRATVVAVALRMPSPMPLVPEELAPRLRSRDARPRAIPREGTHDREILSLSGVSFTYPGAERPAVRDASFTLAAGERVALVGPTGSGKSTLARIALGLRRPDVGEVTLAGMSTRRTPMSRLAAAAGLVLQDPVRQLIAERVDDEIRMGLGHLPARERDARVEHALERYALADLRSRHPLTLSEGERRRVVLAAATARQPALLVLDEPTLGQDGRRRDELARLMIELARAGTAILVISHDPEFVHDACERALVLREGALVADVRLGPEPADVERSAAAGVPLADVPATVRLLARAGSSITARTVDDLVSHVTVAAARS